MLGIPRKIPLSSVSPRQACCMLHISWSLVTFLWVSLYVACASAATAKNEQSKSHLTKALMKTVLPTLQAGAAPPTSKKRTTTSSTSTSTIRKNRKKMKNKNYSTPCRKKAVNDLHIELASLKSTYCKNKLVDFYCSELYEDAVNTFPQCAHMRDQTMNMDFFECYPELDGGDVVGASGNYRSKTRDQENGPAKIAYFLTVNENTRAIWNLHPLIVGSTSDNILLVHVDAKVLVVNKKKNNSIKLQVHDNLPRNTFILPRSYEIVKGGNTLLKTKLYAMAFLLKQNFDFFIPISETHLVLKPGIENFLALYRGWNFIAMDPCWQHMCARPLGFSCVDDDDSNHGDESAKTLKQVKGINDDIAQGKLATSSKENYKKTNMNGGVSMTFKRSLAMHKPLRFRQRFARGPEWVILARDFVQEIVLEGMGIGNNGNPDYSINDSELLFSPGGEGREWVLNGLTLDKDTIPSRNNRLQQTQAQLRAHQAENLENLNPTTKDIDYKIPPASCTATDVKNIFTPAESRKDMLYLIRDALAQYQSDEAFFAQAIRHSESSWDRHINANLHLNGFLVHNTAKGEPPSSSMERVFHGPLDEIGTNSPGYLEDFIRGRSSTGNKGDKNIHGLSTASTSLQAAAKWIHDNFFEQQEIQHEYFFARKVKLSENQKRYLFPGRTEDGSGISRILDGGTHKALKTLTVSHIRDHHFDRSAAGALKIAFTLQHYMSVPVSLDGAYSPLTIPVSCDTSQQSFLLKERIMHFSGSSSPLRAIRIGLDWGSSGVGGRERENPEEGAVPLRGKLYDDFSSTEDQTRQSRTGRTIDEDLDSLDYEDDDKDVVPVTTNFSARPKKKPYAKSTKLTKATFRIAQSLGENFRGNVVSVIPYLHTFDVALYWANRFRERNKENAASKAKKAEDASTSKVEPRHESFKYTVEIFEILVEEAEQRVRADQGDSSVRQKQSKEPKKVQNKQKHEQHLSSTRQLYAKITTKMPPKKASGGELFMSHSGSSTPVHVLRFPGIKKRGKYVLRIPEYDEEVAFWVVDEADDLDAGGQCAGKIGGQCSFLDGKSDPLDLFFGKSESAMSSKDEMNNKLSTATCMSTFRTEEDLNLMEVFDVV
ncbi:unnamed protein product [Amoebophrya sp. A25]|nr:unnamed protein product [Amoebophrya sp. A25]|eukprot:GSA25T00008726001.1